MQRNYTWKTSTNDLCIGKEQQSRGGAFRLGHPLFAWNLGRTAKAGGRWGLQYRGRQGPGPELRSGIPHQSLKNSFHQRNSTQFCFSQMKSFRASGFSKYALREINTGRKNQLIGFLQILVSNCLQKEKILKMLAWRAESSTTHGPNSKNAEPLRLFRPEKRQGWGDINDKDKIHKFFKLLIFPTADIWQLFFSYILVEPPDMGWGSIENGLWTGIAGQFFRKVWTLTTFQPETDIFDAIDKKNYFCSIWGLCLYFCFVYLYFAGDRPVLRPCSGSGWTVDSHGFLFSFFLWILSSDVQKGGPR